MKSRTIALILLMLLGVVFSGCAFKEYRAQKIHLQQPQWDEVTVQKVAAGKVEIGMTDAMVVAALGKPHTISKEGDYSKWVYATLETYGQGSVYYKYVYSVYLKDGQVVKTEGDRSKLGLRLW
jgi:outer membrane protein assembly factor BamE (lipoprotein component of BamABCDE complex)